MITWSIWTTCWGQGEYDWVVRGSSCCWEV